MFVCLVFFGAYAEAQEARLPISVSNGTASALTDYTVRVELNASNARGSISLTMVMVFRSLMVMKPIGSTFMSKAWTPRQTLL